VTALQRGRGAGRRARVRAAIEVCDTRYAAWGVQGEWSRLADQACHGALVVGSGTHRRGGPAALVGAAVSLSVNGTLAVQHAPPGATRRATRCAC
jgi:2-keto-4-pentenoate hydratase